MPLPPDKSNGKVITLVPQLYAQWRAECLGLPALHETGPLRAPSEHLLQQVWLHQRLRHEALWTLDGQPVAILHPGFLNREAGPDFHHAIVQLGESPALVGDIEIDLRPEGWRQHQHADNPAYRDVRLHVVWEPGGAATVTLPTLPLHTALDAPLPELQHWLAGGAETDLPPAQVGACAPALRALPARPLLELLAQAAWVRFERKAAELEARARQSGWRQALREGLFAALGYKHNVWPMRRLAGLLPRLLPPPEAPAPAALALQARLLGVGNLLPAELTRAQPETDSYLRRVWDLWWREADGFTDAILPRSMWRFHGLRPANHPQRRLALATHWLVEPDWEGRLEAWLTTDLPPGVAARTLADRLQAPPDDFWSWHWTLRSPRLARPQPLLGLPRATDLAINVLLPWLWVRARAGGNQVLRRRAQQRFEAWPAGQDNAVLRLARQRLLGGERLPQPHTAATQQGLLQLVQDFCHCSNALCQQCPLPERVQTLVPGDAKPREAAEPC